MKKSMDQMNDSYKVDESVSCWYGNFGKLAVSTDMRVHMIQPLAHSQVYALRCTTHQMACQRIFTVEQELITRWWK